MKNDMYGRKGTLKYLDKAISNSKLYEPTRQQAERAKENIIKQLKDKKLMEMRARLIRATRAGDQVAVDRIERQMRAYEKK